MALSQHGGALDFTSVSGPERLAGYLQTTFLGMGDLVALVIADDLPPVDFNVGLLRNITRRIWPLQAAFEWPIGVCLTDDDAAAAATIINVLRANFRNAP